MNNEPSPSPLTSNLREPTEAVQQQNLDQIKDDLQSIYQDIKQLRAKNRNFHWALTEERDYPDGRSEGINK